MKKRPHKINDELKQYVACVIFLVVVFSIKNKKKMISFSLIQRSKINMHLIFIEVPILK